MPVCTSYAGKSGSSYSIRRLGRIVFLLGVVGVFLPILPTTPFMLLALWAFSRGSKRLHDYVWQHPRFGPYVQDWTLHRIIPRKAKVAAVTMLSVSAIYLLLVTSLPNWAKLAGCTIMLMVATWLWVQSETNE
ncbi:MAG: YbaN family protein [Pseudomonadota bacterium]